MSAVGAAGRKKNLLLCFDAFGTLFTPRVSIAAAYAATATRHGIECGDPQNPQKVAARFEDAFKQESQRNPNYGHATGLGATKWWSNVIRNTFDPFLKPDQQFPEKLVAELIKRYSTQEGYALCPDVWLFFQMLRTGTVPEAGRSPWMWDKTVVGIISNSDDRIPDVLKSFGLKVGSRRVGTQDERNSYASLGNDIDFVVLSYDVGVEKPDRRIFDAATDMLRETLERENDGLTVDDFEKLYVGDDLEKDYEGAQGAGWDSLLLRRRFKVNNVISQGKVNYGKNLVLSKTGDRKFVFWTRNLFALRHFRPNRSIKEGLSRVWQSS